ncbi:TatD family hydrolase [Litorimonas sp. RW-G-Af-16]|uniref:TatD family hydrolase n=1 Tax=Litorimonas sp. RW-G-Af-16 TaxID=3241168 RepID=UPI003AAE2F45
MLVDSHVNLHGEKFADDLDDVIARAGEADIGYMLNICCNIKDFDAVIEVAERGANIFASVGTHPHDAKDNPDITPDQLIEMAQHPKVIGIGETGFDFHYGYSSQEAQITNFKAHIIASQETQLPLIIHTREADELMMETLKQALDHKHFPAELHCYTSGPELAEWASDQDFYFSVSGILTFKNAHDVRALARAMPDDRIMLETDCPYLAPIPHRGRRNEPAFVREVCQGLADVKGWSFDETAQRTTDAFFNLFQKAVR